MLSLFFCLSSCLFFAKECCEGKKWTDSPVHLLKLCTGKRLESPTLEESVTQKVPEDMREKGHNPGISKIFIQIAELNTMILKNSEGLTSKDMDKASLPSSRYGYETFQRTRKWVSGKSSTSCKVWPIIRCTYLIILKHAESSQKLFSPGKQWKIIRVGVAAHRSTHKNL